MEKPVAHSEGEPHPTDINESRTTSQDLAQGALGDAASHLRRCLCPDGRADGAGEDFDLPEKHWAEFRAWSQKRGLILEGNFPPPERDGGREHDVRFDEAVGCWWKYTKPNMAGYTVSWSEGAPFLHNALVLDYFERVELQNDLFGDDVRLAGLWNPQGNDWRIVTIQPDVQGDRATLDELQEAFQRAQFELLPWRGVGYADSLAFRKEGIDVWDIHPANVLITEDGLPLPFDVLLTRTPVCS